MVHEIIDHLDEKGNIIGRIDKQIAHRDGLWHRSVHVWVINNNDEILLQKRCSQKKFYPNVWDCSFAGHIGAGESSLDSAIREGKEEIGIDIDVNKMQYLFTNKEMFVYEKIKSNEFVDVYLLKQDININDIKIQEEEVADVKYIPLKAFFNLVDNKTADLFPHDVEYQKMREILIR